MAPVRAAKGIWKVAAMGRQRREDIADKNVGIDGGESFTLVASENYPLVLKNLPPICASSSQFL